MAEPTVKLRRLHFVAQLETVSAGALLTAPIQARTCIRLNRRLSSAAFSMVAQLAPSCG